MPIMFCYIDPFIMTQNILEISEDNSFNLASGSIDDVCKLMASYYQTGKYSQIVLKGSLAETAADQIRTYGKLNYNLNDIEIEVLK